LTNFFFRLSDILIAFFATTAKCKRVNVGGKLLTNYLKEVVSYRQWNMMDEFKIIDQVSADGERHLFVVIQIEVVHYITAANASLPRCLFLCKVKEDLCYVSKDFNGELLKSKRKAGSDLSIDAFGEHLKKYFALPDYQSIMKGFVKRDDESLSAEEQVARLSN
jgi:Actin